jgi:hypothetical protein
MYIYVRGVNSTIFLSEFAAVLTVWYMLFVVVLLLESTYTNNSLNVINVNTSLVVYIYILSWQNSCYYCYLFGWTYVILR